MQENPELPQISNTDGDPLVPTELHYRLECSPEEAYQALRSLEGDLEDGELPLDAIRDNDGKLRSVVVDWIRRRHQHDPGGGNTLLGHLQIDRDRLKVEVNSEERAQRIRREIKQRLGQRAIYERSVMSSLKRLLEEAQRSPRQQSDHRRHADDEALQQLPEVRQLKQRFMEERWKSWVDEPIPALGNVTPRVAAQTKAGRERLEALLREFAWRDEQAPDATVRAPIARLRRELGL